VAAQGRRGRRNYAVSATGVPRAVRWVLWVLWWGCLAFSVWFFRELYNAMTSV
jgi:hypothetical protein